jgi:hypothetical protein
MNLDLSDVETNESKQYGIGLCSKQITCIQAASKCPNTTQLYHYYYSRLYQLISNIVWIQPKPIAKKVVSIYVIYVE